MSNHGTAVQSADASSDQSSLHAGIVLDRWIATTTRLILFGNTNTPCVIVFRMTFQSLEASPSHGLFQFPKAKTILAGSSISTLLQIIWAGNPQT
jgi:hypothetical protein